MDHKIFVSENDCCDLKAKERAQRIAAAFSVCLCCLILGLTTADGEKYEDDFVDTAITFTPPKKQEAEGIWDIFSDAVRNLFYVRI